MYKHILLPTDGSELSAKAVKQAIRLAESIGAKITAVNVTPQYPHEWADEEHSVTTPKVLRKRFNEERAEGSKLILDKVKSDAREAGVDCQGISVPSNEPYEAIIKQAKKGGCDLIMMASHGRRGLSGVLIGSETTKVLTHSKIPVLVIR
jgi:nucleotide-binding universal stress UspA family protein